MSMCFFDTGLFCCYRRLGKNIFQKHSTGFSTTSIWWKNPEIRGWLEALIMQQALNWLVPSFLPEKRQIFFVSLPENDVPKKTSKNPEAGMMALAQQGSDLDLFRRTFENGESICILKFKNHISYFTRQQETLKRNRNFTAFHSFT